MGQTDEQEPAKWHPQTPCSVLTRLQPFRSRLVSHVHQVPVGLSQGLWAREEVSVAVVGQDDEHRPHFMQ